MIQDKQNQQQQIIQCACGCGKELELFNRWGYERKFIHGHSSPNTYRIKKGQYKGDKHFNWKGGRVRHSNGYVLIWKPEHPFATKDGYVMEHRLRYEEYYKCNLLSYIDIHHKNGDRTDNRIENLVPLTKRKHNHIHKIVNQDSRFCSNCKGKSSIEKRGTFNWYKISNNKFICQRCYGFIYRKMKREKYSNYNPIL